MMTKAFFQCCAGPRPDRKTTRADRPRAKENGSSGKRPVSKTRRARRPRRNERGVLVPAEDYYAGMFETVFKARSIAATVAAAPEDLRRQGKILGRRGIDFVMRADVGDQPLGAAREARDDDPTSLESMQSPTIVISRASQAMLKLIWDSTELPVRDETWDHERRVEHWHTVRRFQALQGAAQGDVVSLLLLGDHPPSRLNESGQRAWGEMMFETSEETARRGAPEEQINIMRALAAGYVCDRDLRAAMVWAHRYLETNGEHFEPLLIMTMVYFADGGYDRVSEISRRAANAPHAQPWFQLLDRHLNGTVALDYSNQGRHNRRGLRLAVPARADTSSGAKSWTM